MATKQMEYMEIEGYVQAIAIENNNGHDKKVITVSTADDQVLFVEFQGKARKLVREIIPQDKVRIRFKFNGKVSKIGRKYNNIIGKSIKILST